MGMGRRDGVVTGHGQEIDMVLLIDMDRRDGVLTGYEQGIWCTDWTGAVDMVYSLDTVGEIVY